MIYAYDITTPANTAQSAPVRTSLRVTKGLVYQVEFEFPPGPLGYCHVAIADGGHQVWPSNPDHDFHGDNGYITFPDTYLKMAAPFEFTAVTWNEDDTYEHTIHIRLGLVTEEVFMARFLPTMTYERMLEVLEEAQKRQQAALEAEREGVLAQPFEWMEG